ncbi:MAG: hypothetical protein A2W25_13765 [candidate division Zixibacteria bacterium RBG_16_53_22]|nr:MAG: hypothetical protein A2W25_13765 [candidate division Zixibacteria bacterium RBG_16_53_22]
METSSDSLNILYFCADRGISIGGTKGASAHIRGFVGALVHAGHKVTAVLRGDRHKGYEQLPFRVIGLPENRPPAKSEFPGHAQGGRHAVSENEEIDQNPHFEQFLRELGSKEKFDFFYERYSLFSIAGLNYVESSGLPFILEVNAPLVLEASRYRKLELMQQAREIERRLFSSADTVIAVSNQLKDYILKTVPDSKVTVVPNGVDVEKFSHTGAATGEPDKPRRFTIGFVGNLRPWHGIDILLESFAGITEIHDDVRLLIIGDIGKMKNQLDDFCQANRLNGKVVFTGAVPQEDIPRLMRQIDVAVAPYPELPDFYFSSLKIFEYMAAGKPIVASRIGQIDEILENDKTALLIPPGNPAALTGALIQLKNDPDLARRLGQRARLEAQSKHTWKDRIEKIEGIMRTLKSKAAT